MKSLPKARINPRQLPKDILSKIVIDLQLSDVLNFCSSCRYFNEKIGNNNTFWNQKLTQDYYYEDHFDPEARKKYLYLYKSDLYWVTQNGYCLKSLKNQTEELCIACVKIFPEILRYVRNQTDKICLAGVKSHGTELYYVKNQTYEICLAAVSQKPYALCFVKNQTYEICMASVRENEFYLTCIRDNEMRKMVEIGIRNEPYCRLVENSIRFVLATSCFLILINHLRS